MLRVETTIGSDNHSPFSITWANTDQASPEVTASHAVSRRGTARGELNLSGYQLLVGFAFLMGLVAAFLWAVKLWLFEP